MSYKLFLDDMRNPYDIHWVPKVKNQQGWYIVRNYEQFKEHIILYGLPALVSFDHDLHDSHYEAMIRESNGEQNVDYGSVKTGYDCVKFLVDYCKRFELEFPEYHIHTLNNHAFERMNSYISFS